jgi:hypothetical protein
MPSSDRLHSPRVLDTRSERVQPQRRSKWVAMKLMDTQSSEGLSAYAMLRGEGGESGLLLLQRAPSLQWKLNLATKSTSKHQPSSTGALSKLPSYEPILLASGHAFGAVIGSSVSALTPDACRSRRIRFSLHADWTLPHLLVDGWSRRTRSVIANGG